MVSDATRCRLCWAMLAVGWTSAVSVGAEPTSDRAERVRFSPEQNAWVELPTPVPGTAAGDLAIARRQLTDHEYNRAQRSITAWMKSYGEASEWYPHALLLSAQVDKALKRYENANNSLQLLLDQYAQSDVASDALVEMFNIAEVFLGGVRRKFLGMRLLDGTDFAVEILDDLSSRYAGSTIALQALKTKADHFYRRGDFELAELEYGRLMQEFSGGRYARYAERRLADSAEARFGGIAFDETPLIEAEERYEAYADQFPEAAQQEGVSLILDGIRERRAAKEFSIGHYYERTHHLEAAAYYYRSTMQRWPDTIAAEKATTAFNALAGVVRDATIEVIESEATREPDR